MTTAALSCGCEEHAPFAVEFYVTARNDDGQHVALAGPWPTHEEALASVERFRRRAYDVDPRAPWYAYGTAGSETGGMRPIFDRETGEVRS